MGVLIDFSPLARNLFLGNLSEISSLRYHYHIPLSDPLKSATSSKCRNEVWGQPGRNEWTKMSFLLLLILMAIEFLLMPSVIPVCCILSFIVYGHLGDSAKL